LMRVAQKMRGAPSPHNSSLPLGPCVDRFERLEIDVQLPLLPVLVHHCPREQDEAVGRDARVEFEALLRRRDRTEHRLPVDAGLDVGRRAELVRQHLLHARHLERGGGWVSGRAVRACAAASSPPSLPRAWSRGGRMSEIMDVPLPRTSSRPLMSWGGGGAGRGDGGRGRAVSRASPASRPPPLRLSHPLDLPDLDLLLRVLGRFVGHGGDGGGRGGGRWGLMGGDRGLVSAPARAPASVPPPRAAAARAEAALARSARAAA